MLQNNQLFPGIIKLRDRSIKAPENVALNSSLFQRTDK